MFKHIILTGLFLGLTILPASPETYTGGISADSDEPVTIAVRIKPKMLPEVPTTENTNYANQYTLQAQQELSVVGVHWVHSGLIDYVDPVCSLYGQVFPGDSAISIDGVALLKATSQRMNYGNSGTPVDIGLVKSSGERIVLTAIRKPISSFTPRFQALLRNP